MPELTLSSAIPEGLCQCGCGEKTDRWKYTDPRRGARKGEVKRFVDRSHGHRKHRNPLDHRPFKIDGVYCCLVPLGDDLWAIVDEADYADIIQFRWIPRWSETSKTHYAVRIFNIDGKQKTESMHRRILGLSESDLDKEADHVEAGNGLDNRRLNLRVASRSQNMMNRRTFKNNSLGIKGIFPENGGYKAVIRTKGKYWQKRSKDLNFLIALRQEMVAKIHGEYARSA